MKFFVALALTLILNATGAAAQTNGTSPSTGVCTTSIDSPDRVCEFRTPGRVIRDALYTCIPEDRQEGATFGVVSFTGSGSLRIEFGDEVVTYNEGGNDDFELLSSLLEDGGHAVRYRDGSIYAIGNDCDISWPLRQNRPTMPLPESGSENASSAHEECMSYFGIVRYQIHDWSRSTTLWVDNPVGEGRLFLNFNRGIYALGQNAWGEWWSIPSSTCASSIVGGAP